MGTVITPSTDLSIAPSGNRASLAPKTLTEAMEFSKLLADSTFVPKDFQKKPGDILIAIQWGMEIGLAPLQALQNIAVINGRPSIWGDAALALVQAHRDYVSHDEGIRGEGLAMVGWHTITRRGQNPYTIEFSVADAQKAGLWSKAGPWTTAPKRMLKLRARGFALRDKFADALKGIVTREEAYDYTPASDEGAAELPTQPTIGKDAALIFWKTWKSIGKRSNDQATSYLADVMKVTNSEHIPLSRLDEAMAWAKGSDTVPTATATPAAVTAELTIIAPPDTETLNKLSQLFDIHGMPNDSQEALLTEYGADYQGLIKHLEEQLPND